MQERVSRPAFPCDESLVWLQSKCPGPLPAVNVMKRHFATGTLRLYPTRYSDVSSQPDAVAGEMRFESLWISPPRVTE